MVICSFSASARVAVNVTSPGVIVTRQRSTDPAAPSKHSARSIELSGAVTCTTAWATSTGQVPVAFQ